METFIHSSETEEHTPAPTSARQAFRSHWPEYLIEAAALGFFMISACVFAVLLEHPASHLHQAIADPLLRRAVGGVAMGLTMVAIVYSRWGKRSGAHMNPAFTLVFLALGKVERWDAFFYVLFQFTGGVAGVLISSLLIGLPLRHPAVNHAVTIPGPAGAAAAFLGELLISTFLMFAVLTISNRKSLARFTGLFAATLVALYITAESPFSGMSMNPARTIGSAIPAWEWSAIWIYFVAPLLGMFTAAAVYRRWHGAHRVFCAKLHHENYERCIFRCNYGAIHDNE
jgi:aquaporin Z